MLSTKLEGSTALSMIDSFEFVSEDSSRDSSGAASPEMDDDDWNTVLTDGAGTEALARGKAVILIEQFSLEEQPAMEEFDLFL